MQYMIMIYGDSAKFMEMTEADRGRMFGAYGAYNEALKDAGVLRGMNWLDGVHSASTLKSSDSGATVHAGAAISSNLALGGYYIVDVADLDAAVWWARQCPGLAMGMVELRPLLSSV